MTTELGTKLTPAQQQQQASRARVAPRSTEKGAHWSRGREVRVPRAARGEQRRDTKGDVGLEPSATPGVQMLCRLSGTMVSLHRA